MIDWIEEIPVGETRNYVQRVLENITIYRARRGETTPTLLAQWRVGQRDENPVTGSDSTGHKPLKIGDIEVANRVLLAPMSGVTDAPFRRLAARLGAGLVVSEMTAGRNAQQALATALALATARAMSEKLDEVDQAVLKESLQSIQIEKI